MMHECNDYYTNTNYMMSSHIHKYNMPYRLSFDILSSLYDDMSDMYVHDTLADCIISLIV